MIFKGQGLGVGGHKGLRALKLGGLLVMKLIGSSKATWDSVTISAFSRTIGRSANRSGIFKYDGAVAAALSLPRACR